MPPNKKDFYRRFSMDVVQLGNILAFAGCGLMLGLAGAGSAMGTATAGMATLGMVKKKPELFGSGIILTAVPGTQGIYGFVGFFLSLQLMSDMTLIKGAVIFGSGLGLGLAGLLSGWYQGRVCADGINAMAGGDTGAFGKTMMLAAFPEFYAILSLIGLILMQGALK
jgi:V/A-type H+-transporting ATPase subunit K